MLSITKWLCGWTLLGDNALNKAQVNEAGQAALHISRAWPISNSLQQNTAAREKDTVEEMARTLLEAPSPLVAENKHNYFYFITSQIPLQGKC